MKEKLILFPELYNTILKTYHNLARKRNVWQNVSSQMGGYQVCE